MNLLKNNKSKHIIYNNKKNKFITNDEIYNNFLIDENGGYYFNNSLHFFGYSENENYHNIEFVNKLIRELYTIDFKDYFCIGEDLFGNLFLFDIESNYYLFLIESGSFEFISNSFHNFINQLEQEIEYFTGCNFLNKMDKTNIEFLSLGYRYCPVVPFVLGGELINENLKIKSFYENLTFSASIYEQIKEIPDGTELNFKFI